MIIITHSTKIKDNSIIHQSKYTTVFVLLDISISFFSILNKPSESK